MTMRNLRRLAIAGMVALLAACGGGGGDGDTDGGADAGALSRQSVMLASGDVRADGSALRATVGGTVRLDAAATMGPDGDVMAYRWSLLSRPRASTLAASGSASVLTFRPDVLGEYLFQLQAVRTSGDVTFHEVAVTADNRPPMASVVVSAAFTPSKVAGRSVTIGANVVVDASGTTDPDGQKVTIKFTLTAKPKGSKAALSTAGRSTRFKADVAGSYALRVVGTDTRGGSFETLYTFIADNRGPNPVLVAKVADPVAKSGSSKLKATVGYDVLLDSARSSDPDGNKIVRAWELVSKPARSKAKLTSASGKTSVLSPDLVGNYLVRLTLTDSRGARSSFDTTVQVDNQRPIAHIGSNASPRSLPSAPDPHLPMGTQVTLRGDASEDDDGDAITYLWTVDQRPSGSSAQLSSATAMSPVFTPDRNGLYLLRLRVTDSRGALSERTLSLRVGDHAPLAVLDKDQVTALVGDTVRASAALSFDPDGDALAYEWTLDAWPVGSTAALATSTTPDVSFVPDLPGIYALAVRVSDGASSSIEYLTLRVLTQFEHSVALDFVPKEARYSRGLDRVVFTTASPHTLRAVDPFTGLATVTVLPAAAANFSLSPDGKLAVVVHAGVFSLVDLETSTVLGSAFSGGNHSDAFVTNAGVVYLIGGASGWVEERVSVFDGRTGKSLPQAKPIPGDGTFYGTQYGVLASRLNKVFLMSWGLSPGDISYFSFDPARSKVTVTGGSPYHGDHSMSTPFYLSSDESLLFTSSGTFFRTSDLRYVGRLDGIWWFRSASHSAARQELLVLPANSSLPEAYTRFAGPLLLPDAELSLPLVGGQRSYGLKIFHSANDSHVVLVQTGSAQAGGAGAAYHLIVR